MHGYALSEIGPELAGEYADRIGELLDDTEGNVVRATTDALCSLNTFSAVTVDRFYNIFVEPDKWHSELMGNEWE